MLDASAFPTLPAGNQHAIDKLSVGLVLKKLSITSAFVVFIPVLRAPHTLVISLILIFFPRIIWHKTETFAY